MKNLPTSLLLAAFLSLQLIAAPQVAASEEERRPSKTRVERIDVEATIEAIDLENSTVDLRGSDGGLVTLAVRDAGKIDGLEVGDRVAASYGVVLSAVFRDPTPEEESRPLVAEGFGALHGEAGLAEAAVGGVVSAIVEIAIINGVDSVVTIKGPAGNYATVPVEDEALLRDLNVGERLILTYLEAAAISIEKLGAADEAE